MKTILPDEYREVEDAELKARIAAAKARLGRDLVVLTHHYQRQDVVDFGDIRGDSFLLSKRAAESAAKYIVFCGVHFMAESAAVLARPDQAVFIPELRAGCPMAEMAPIADVERAWAEITGVVDASAVAPITYVNSTAAVKAFCGANRGATCTSSNADKIFKWALTGAEKIFFLPDEHLGRNTAFKLGLEPVALWDPGLPRGGLTAGEARAAKVIVWKGFCHVHTAFTVEQIKQKRREYPGCKVAVHPECRREVVAAADHAASTEGIIKYTAAQDDGATVVIGTEINLVERLGLELAGRVSVIPLARSLCPNMYRIGLPNLCWALDGIVSGPEHWVNRVTVAEDVKRDAARALTRMLEHG